MHRDVDPVVQQGLVDLLGEQAFATDVGERAVLHGIARGGDHLFLQSAVAQLREGVA
jgi:hypothetical protein